MAQFITDSILQLCNKFLQIMDSKSQYQLMLGGTALLALVVALAYQRTHAEFLTKETDLPKKSLDRILRLRHTSDEGDSDPPLLRKHSTFDLYTTSYATYPSVRTFHCPHLLAEKLPEDSQPLPLLVLLHGLGGSMAQFAPLLGSLVNIAPCLGIDLPGSGLSKFDPKNGARIPSRQWSRS